jgi:hypothetical protein
MSTKTRAEFAFFQGVLDDLLNHNCDGLGIKANIASWTATPNLDLEISAEPASANVWIKLSPWLDETGNTIQFIFRLGEFKIMLSNYSKPGEEETWKDITEQFIAELKPTSLNVLVDLLRLLYAYSRAL